MSDNDAATRAHAIDQLSRTLWGEARGCGREGMMRVAAVILNRAKNSRWWGHDIPSVCRAPYQFSCWNSDDPNLPKLLAVTPADPWYNVALAVAATAVDGTLSDLTGGADSYYALSMKAPPFWTRRAVHTVSDGWHSFWRVELPPPNNPETDDPDAPNISWHAVNADDLNARELNRVRSST